MRETRNAYAKVNLALDILGTRPDGYHDMRMVMQTISLCDVVTVEETSLFPLMTNWAHCQPQDLCLWRPLVQWQLIHSMTCARSKVLGTGTLW